MHIKGGGTTREPPGMRLAACEWKSFCEIRTSPLTILPSQEMQRLWLDLAYSTKKRPEFLIGSRAGLSPEDDGGTFVRDGAKDSPAEQRTGRTEHKEQLG